MQACRNCSQPVSTPFCPHCGQSSAFTRFSLKHFVFHNLINGVFGLDKGFLYTVKMLFTRPGHSIRGYVEGQRVQHFHYFTLVVLLLTFAHWLAGMAGVPLLDTTHVFSAQEAYLTDFEQFSSENPKLFAFFRIPFQALVSLLVFRMAGLNFTEHLVLTTYKLSAELVITLALTLVVAAFTPLFPVSRGAAVCTVVLLVYSFWFYHQFFSVYGYSRAGLLIRSLLTSVLLTLAATAVSEFVVGMKKGFEGG